MTIRHQNATCRPSVPAWAPVLVALFVFAIGLNFARFLHPLPSLTTAARVVCKCSHTKYQRFDRIDKQWSAPAEEPRFLLSSSTRLVLHLKQVHDPLTVVADDRYNRPPPAC